MLYLSMIHDLYDISIVAYKTGIRQTVNLILDTVRLAMTQQKRWPRWEKRRGCCCFRFRQVGQMPARADRQSRRCNATIPCHSRKSRSPA